jgi:hypothetical protein
VTKDSKQPSPASSTRDDARPSGERQIAAAIEASREEDRLALTAVATAVGLRPARGKRTRPAVVLSAESRSQDMQAADQQAETARALPTLVLKREADLATCIRALDAAHVQSVVVAEGRDLVAAVRAAGELVAPQRGLAALFEGSAAVRHMEVFKQSQRESALDHIRSFCKSVGLRAQSRATVEMVIDELLMNALYNAPVDDQGKPLLAEVTPAERVSMELSWPVTIELAFDGRRLACSVRDEFGSLTRGSILAAIRRCLDDGVRPQDKTSGAGLGLFFVANNVYPPMALALRRSRDGLRYNRKQTDPAPRWHLRPGAGQDGLACRYIAPRGARRAGGEVEQAAVAQMGTRELSQLTQTDGNRGPMVALMLAITALAFFLAIYAAFFAQK